MKKISFGLLIILLIFCCANNADIDAELSVIQRLKNGTVYKITVKTNEYYYPHYLFIPDTAAEGELFPVLYVCGAPTPDSIFFDIGFAAFLDNMIGEHKTPPLALVAASGLDFYTDFEDTLFNKLIPYLEANFPVATDRHHKAICGISAGGSLALGMAYNHRHAFGVLALHSATLVGDDHDKIRELLTFYEPEDKFELFIDVGKSDPLFAAHTLLLSKIESAPREFTFITSPGRHAISYWQRQLPAYFAWYSSVLCN
jgi:enterochelin esterase-like enzyme